ncbi:hypothetical protein [Agrococcus sp. ARC_14]|uniref:hypothetical protein n=1 Tax=Agrococcus sp. ARC_14 TaxID=2919927 RepID=UPI001F05E6F2|nr:hypothetical protein [Agrococcus sp. ARC_14]MCH1881504.1 hypothetical protein [Agrococcus sp. ARC_14]
MELSAGEAAFDADVDRWVPVPLAFPAGDWPTASSWAEDVTAELAPYWSLSDLQRADLAHTALTVASTEPPLPGAIARFWHLPVVPDVSRVVHAYAEPLEPGWSERLEEWATDGYEGAVFQRAEAVESSVYARLFRTSALWPLPGAADGGAAAVLRVLGEIEDMIVVIEIIDMDIRIAARLFDAAVELAESVRLGR